MSDASGNYKIFGDLATHKCFAGIIGEGLKPNKEDPEINEAIFGT